ncbi:MAG: hypothetical protein NUV77_03330 [Thermoguttaceae bacterium]|jgi:hypothetical protein|nr:hypothetical protein [Thermoguttaceae bacterium]
MSRGKRFAGLAVVLAVCGVVRADDGLTFFGWSDQHVQTSGDAKHLVPAIDAMNSLPGTTYPQRIGGVVAAPAFVFGCGDVTEWPTRAAKNTYDELITKRLKFPAYDILGNHDTGGKSPSDTLSKWITQRHGSLSYTFDCRGVHFVALYSQFDDNLDNPAQPIRKEALDFLRKSLARLPEGTPVVVAAHLCFDAMTNRDEVVEAIGTANVVLVLGGHYHKSKADLYRDVRFLQLPSPAPNGTGEVMVVRIGPDRLVAMPYNYREKRWTDRPSVTFDAPIRGPKPGAVPRDPSPRITRGPS